MSLITRGILRYGLIGGLALGGAAILFPIQTKMGLSHLRHATHNVVGQLVDDPIVLRQQLQDLANQYPDRIEEVRGELAEVTHQIAQSEKEMDVDRLVVAMTTDDLEQLKALVSRAEAEAASGVRTVAIRYEGVRYDLEEAYNEGRRLANIRESYQDRMSHDEFQQKLLVEQRSRLSEILGKLESEYDTYLTQLWQLDRQVDAIERNDRIIELTERQQATLDSYDRFGKVQNLKQLEGKLAELRAKQKRSSSISRSVASSTTTRSGPATSSRPRTSPTTPSRTSRSRLRASRPRMTAPSPSRFRSSSSNRVPHPPCSLGPPDSPGGLFFFKAACRVVGADVAVSGERGNPPPQESPDVHFPPDHRRLRRCRPFRHRPGERARDQHPA